MNGYLKIELSIICKIKKVNKREKRYIKRKRINKTFYKISAYVDDYMLAELKIQQLRQRGNIQRINDVYVDALETLKAKSEQKIAEIIYK